MARWRHNNSSQKILVSGKKGVGEFDGLASLDHEMKRYFLFLSNNFKLNI
jgi:hypothetical protein